MIWPAAVPRLSVTALGTAPLGKAAPGTTPLGLANALEHIASFTGHTVSYTDHSKCDGGVRCAFVNGNDTRGLIRPRNASVFTSKLVAVAKIFCFILVGNEDLHLILTDSLSSLFALTRAAILRQSATQTRDQEKRKPPAQPRET